MHNLSYFIWTQPADPLASDVMSCDGVLLPTDDKLLRQDLVSWASDLAASPRRRRLANGGFLVETSAASLAEVPVGPPAGTFAPIVTIALVNSPSRPSPQRLVDDVSSAAEAAGHVPERGGLADVAVLLTREVGTDRRAGDNGSAWWTAPQPDGGSTTRPIPSTPGTVGYDVQIGRPPNPRSPFFVGLAALWNWLRRLLGVQNDRAT
jgi:hypothetical protein